MSWSQTQLQAPEVSTGCVCVALFRTDVLFLTAVGNAHSVCSFEFQQQKQGLVVHDNDSPDEHGPHGHSHVLSGRDQCTLCRFSRRDEQRGIVYPAVEGESVDQSGILRPPEEKAI